eukprot:TRINITY_DN27863_c0_g1_i1.p2 TRINITY_DN27863_c0_g1~~TRINITY_DN27863_c0_g1_i1.p2  ORF type:complete len:354 (-),score=112.84 TRINITY_DN27863_c0_g1_i1:205-1266(-)
MSSSAPFAKKLLRPLTTTSMFELTLDARTYAVANADMSVVVSTFMTRTLLAAPAKHRIYSGCSSLLASAHSGSMAAMDLDFAALAGIKRRADSSNKDGERPAKTPAAASGKGAKAPTAGKASATDKNLVHMIAQLTLSNARELANIKAAVVVTIQVERAKLQSLVDSIKTVTQSYAEQVRTLPEGSKGMLGSPHLYVWLELCSSTMKLIDTDDGYKKQKQTIGDYLASKVEMSKTKYAAFQANKAAKISGPAAAATTEDEDSLQLKGSQEEVTQVFLREAVAEDLYMCKLSKMWKPTHSKIEFSAKPGTQADLAATAITDVLVGVGGAVKKLGPAPKGILERSIAEALTSKKA